MNIFNSLGSNYTTAFSIKSLFKIGSKKDQKAFINILNNNYQGHTTLTYKGREALELAFLNSNLDKGSKVAINGYTCYVVYRAIKRVGLEPVFIDTKKGDVNFSDLEIEKNNKANDLKAIVIQNTLGYPVDIDSIKKYADKHKLLIIEDLAHSQGAVYQNGIEAGKIGDFTMLSFSQDKPLDVVAGGALIDRRKDPDNKTTLISSSWLKRQRNRLYPLFTKLIRSLYTIQLGRILHHILKKLNLLSNPMDDAGKGIHKMSPSASSLALNRWQTFNEELSHRRSIAAIYEQKINKSVQLQHIFGQPSYLRFPLLIDDPKSLINILKKNGVHIGDTWYDAPIGPKRYLSKTSYKKGLCPNAEYLSSHMLNLPTHLNINENQAKIISERINIWLKSQ